MYNLIQIENELNRLSPEVGGVFSCSDLIAMLNKSESYSGEFAKILSSLVKNKLLYRFCRGFYVRKEFDIGILSQKIDPESYISFTNILGKECIVGATAGNSITAVSPKPRPRKFESPLACIRYVKIDRSLMGFGIKKEDCIRVAETEKAFLDVLYFYKKGMKFNFNVYSDINVDLMDIDKILLYLENYQNPNFKGFVRSVINENRKI